MGSLVSTQKQCCAFFTALFALVLLLATASQSWANNEKVAKFVEQFFQPGSAEEAVSLLGQNNEIVNAFYASRNFKPVWTRDSGPKGKGKALFQELNRSVIHGLSPEFYSVEEIGALMNATNPEDIATLDMLLSSAFINYAHDLRNGRIRAAAGNAVNQVTPIRFSADELISGAADSGNLRNFASLFLDADDRYIRLIAKYIEFDRALKAKVWPKIDASGAPIVAGASDQRMDSIRRLLLLTGDLSPDAAEGDATHDKDTQKAVRSYQKRHGLERSGDIDAPTLSAMAVPLADRMRQILINLERRRWQNQELGENHIYANLADGSARVVINGERIGFLNFGDAAATTKLPTFYAKASGIRNEGAETFLILSDVPQAIATDGMLKVAITQTEGSSVADFFGEAIGKADGEGNILFEEPLDVYITYVTAWANKNGTVNFRPDAANRDRALAEALLGGS